MYTVPVCTYVYGFVYILYTCFLCSRYILHAMKTFFQFPKLYIKSVYSERIMARQVRIVNNAHNCDVNWETEPTWKNSLQSMALSCGFHAEMNGQLCTIPYIICIRMKRTIFCWYISVTGAVLTLSIRTYKKREFEMLYTYKKALLPEYCVQQTYRVVLLNLSIGFSGCYHFYMYIVQCKAYFLYTHLNCVHALHKIMCILFVCLMCNA